MNNQDAFDLFEADLPDEAGEARWADCGYSPAGQRQPQ